LLNSTRRAFSVKLTRQPNFRLARYPTGVVISARWRQTVAKAA
jgi:hypothetical protein